MTYDGGFIMQKAVDWSLLRSSSARLLPKGRKNDGMTNIIIISPNYHRIIHRNNPKFNRRSSERRFELVQTLPSREGGRPKANRKKFQFEFKNGEALRLKAAIKREKNGARSNFSEREQARPKVKLYEHLKM